MPEQVDTSAIPQPPLEKPKGQWKRLDFMNVFGGRTAAENALKDANALNNNLKQDHYKAQVDRANLGAKTEAELKLQQTAATNELNRIQGAETIKTQSEVDRIKRLEQMLRNNTYQLGLLNGLTPEQANIEADKTVFGNAVLPAQISNATNLNNLGIVAGQTPFGKSLGTNMATSAIAALKAKEAADAFSTKTNEQSMAGIPSIVASGQSAADMANRAAAAASTDELIATTAVPTGTTAELARKNADDKLAQMQFFKEYPVLRPNVKLPDYNTAPIETIRELNTLGNNGQVSGVLSMPSSAVTNWIPGRTKPITPGSKPPPVFTLPP